MPSNRTFTNEQFSDGTTIDGNRLASAIESLENFANEIPGGYVSTRWMQTQYIMKYLPATGTSDVRLAAATFAGNYRHYPWLPMFNQMTEENPARIKGTQKADSDFSPSYQTDISVSPYDEYHTTSLSLITKAVWQSVFRTGKSPAIIDSLSGILLTDTVQYVNNLSYASSPPINETVGSPVKDIQLCVTVDNPFAGLKQNQDLNTVVFNKANFDVSNSVFSRAAPAAYTDMFPNVWAAGTPTWNTSVAIQETNLCIPVPPESNVRVSLLLNNQSNPWGEKPWYTVNPTVTLTMLEGLEDG